MKEKKVKIFKIFKQIIVLLIIFFGIITVYTKMFPKGHGFVGLKTFVIATPSMNPTYKVGDIIVVRNIKHENIKVEDIICYQGMSGDFAGKIITHRVKDIATENGKRIFYTKGDANIVTDPAVYEEQIYGTVVYRPLILSLISRAMRHFWGFLFCILIPLSVLFMAEFTDLKKLIDEKQTRKKTAKGKIEIEDSEEQERGKDL